MTERPKPPLTLHVCQRISLAAASIPGVRGLWPSVSRVMPQFWARRVTDPMPARLPGGASLPVRLSEHVEAGVFWYGFPAEDRGALAVLRDRLPRDGVALDVGANVGCFSLVLATDAPAGQVHAFEPVRGNRERLERAIADNGLENITVNACALAAEAGELTVWVPQAHWKGRLYNAGRSSPYVGRGEHGWAPETVPCLTLDEYVAQQGLRRVDVIKIDVEGAEMDVLEGARRTLSELRPAVVMERNDSLLAAAGRDPDAVRTLWDDLRYRIHYITPAGTLRRRLPKRSSHCNILCLP
ncbi:FkbM family methyltransferase [Arhodomonas sp. SL1]|uniref:FkbM family methyltransferase n=1 Tax=Arhodomonas sp. SL1 TaxID=3425691 RepID=UPI003F883ACD